ncbi:MAG TPA: hypothetical protein VGR26_18425 [Acidimicrobiales bacterium]|nr:hypothetical protein [Acidimicrobiales bacterium]
MKRALLSVLGLIAAGLGVVQMAEYTMTRHEPVPPDSRMAVVVEAHTKGHSPYSRLQMTRSLFLACRLQVNTTVVEDNFRTVAPDTFRFVLEPTLDDSDQRQLRGCLEDARIDQLQLDVRSIERVTSRTEG